MYLFILIKPTPSVDDDHCPPAFLKYQIFPENQLFLSRWYVSTWWILNNPKYIFNYEIPEDNEIDDWNSEINKIEKDAEIQYLVDLKQEWKHQVQEHNINYENINHYRNIIESNNIKNKDTNLKEVKKYEYLLEDNNNIESNLDIISNQNEVKDENNISNKIDAVQSENEFQIREEQEYKIYPENYGVYKIDDDESNLSENQ